MTDLTEAILANTAPQVVPCPLCDETGPHAHPATEWRAWEAGATCMICDKPAVVDVAAPVTLDGQAAPAGRRGYPPMRITLCAAHRDEYHPEVTP